MAREYFVLEDMSIREAAKPLISVAMHPSGYYMAASFIDKIRVHHILNDEFKHYKNIDIRYCKLMKFSQGGHLFACINEDKILIYNAYTLIKLRAIQLGQAGKFMTQIIFHEKDKAITVSGQHNYIGRWDLPSYKKVYESKFEIVEIKSEDDPNIVVETKH